MDFAICVQCKDCGRILRTPFRANEKSRHILIQQFEIGCPCGGRARTSTTYLHEGVVTVFPRPGDSKTWPRRIEELRRAIEAVRTPEDVAALEANPEYSWAKPIFEIARKLWKNQDLQRWAPFMLSLLVFLLTQCQTDQPSVNINQEQIINLWNATVEQHAPPAAVQQELKLAPRDGDRPRAKSPKRVQRSGAGELHRRAGRARGPGRGGP